MPRPASTQPTDGELEILRVLWANGPSALSVIHRTICEEREVALTTVATMLKKMADKKLVLREGSAKTAVWKAKLTHQAAARGMVGKLVETVFAGSTRRLLSHLVESGQITAAEVKALQVAVKKSRR
jgi:BlaI family transcriptional regulator, penicillinase repressor